MASLIKQPLMAVMIPAATVPVPVMIVFPPSVVALPIAIEKAFTVVTRANPACAFVRRARPIAVMPPIVVADWIPIALHPEKSWTRADRDNVHNPWGRRRADSYSN